VINNGIIVANTRGYNGDAVAFQDNSGTVTSFRNNSRLVAGYTDDNVNDTITSGTGRAIALDLSHSLSNVTVTQSEIADNARIFGDVLFGAGNDRFDLLSGEVFGGVDFGGGSDTFVINSAGLTGNTTFRGTNASVSLDNSARMIGALSLGNAGGALNFVGGSTYDGAITRSSNTANLSMVVNNSTMNNRGAGTLQLNSMQLANNAKVGFVINNARVASNTPIFNVVGAADVAANTVFTPIFEQFTAQPLTLTVLNANTLNLGGSVSSMLNAQSPFLYNVSLTRPAGTNSLQLSLRTKTASELGLNLRQASAYSSVLDLLSHNDTIAQAVTAISTGGEFDRAWSDLLPGPDSDVTQVLASNATAAFGATAHRLDLVMQKPEAPGGAWVEEFGVYHESDNNGAALGTFGGGFGVAAGLDLIASRNWVLGAYTALESLEIEERGRTAAPINVAQTSFGAYGGLRLGQIAVNGAASAGYSDFTSDRDIKLGTITDRARASWKATTVTSAARATWTLPLFDFLDITPYAAVDYIKVNQDGYREKADTNSALELVVGDSESSLSTASYGIALQGKFGDSGGNFVTRPEVSIGYRNVLSWDNPSGLVRFGGSSTGSTFAPTPGHEPESAVVAGLGLNVYGQFVNLKFGYDAEISDSQITHYGSITLRLAFW
jgi:uncharacterized protein with beta-barrel porin domain